MRTIFLAALSVSIAVTAVAAAPRSDRVYVDDRYGIASVVPKEWTLQPPDPKLNGTRFTSRDGSGSLALYKEPAGRNVAAHMNAVAFVRGERITYLRRARSWIVVSGFRGDRIFYRKAMPACGNNTWHHVAFGYPAAEKRAYDRLVTRTSHALKMHENDGCRPE